MMKNEYNISSVDNSANKQIRPRFKGQTTTDIIPLVAFHDAVSQSTTFDSTTA